MSTSIRISSGFGTTLQHIPNTCIFRTKHTCMDVGFPILSVEECRKRAWISVSNRNPHTLFLPSATLKYEEFGTSKGKGDQVKDPPSEITTTMMTIARFLMDYDDPSDHVLDGLETLLRALQVWRMILSSFEFDFNDGHLQIPRPYFYPSTTWEDEVKNPLPKITKGVMTILKLLMDLNDPNDGLMVLLGALEVWRIVLCTAGYDYNKDFTSQGEKKNFSPDIIKSVLEISKIMIDSVDDPADFGEYMSQVMQMWFTMKSEYEASDN